MAKSKIKVKTVEITNNLLPSKPKLYKPALQTPTVVSSEKFIENISKETGLSRFQAANVLSCIFQTAGDYMELGNAVQMHEDFGTLKPYIRVKAVSDRDKCNGDCIQGMGLRLIPTGKMRSILGGVQFVFTGMSNGSDVEESEVVNPDPTTPTDPAGPTDPTNNNDTEYTAIFYDYEGTIISSLKYKEGDTIVDPEPPEGYAWNTHPATMPARDINIFPYEIATGV